MTHLIMILKIHYRGTRQMHDFEFWGPNSDLIACLLLQTCS